MSTKDIENEANAAIESLLALGKAGEEAAKQRKKEIETARKRQNTIDYAARLANRAEQDKIDEAQEVLSQIDPDLPEPAAPVVVVPEPVPVPAPVVDTPPAPLPEPAAPVVVVPEPEPAPTRVQAVVNDTNPTNWVGWVPWALAIVGLILGWAVGGEWLNQASQPVLWDWVAWLFKPIMAAVGFFGGGLLGSRLTQRQPAAVRPAEA